MLKNSTNKSDIKLSLNTFVKLVRSAETITRKSSDTFRKEGLTESQFGILEALYHLGRLCQNDIGNKILKSKGNITHVIDNMVKQTLVNRIRSQNDKRFIYIELTEKGRELIERIFPMHAARIHELFSVLSSEEAHTLGVLCRKLGTHQTEINVPDKEDI